MQYTTHYNLNLPEGTDIVNPLVQDNPNYSAIDTALYNNKVRVVGNATEIKSGTVHAVTRSDSDIDVMKFTATGDWITGDTMTVDGTPVSVYLQDGTAPLTGAYVINTEVVAVINGSRVTLYGAQKLPSYTASDISYDNTGSGLAATDVQDAIDDVASDVSTNTSAIADLQHYNYGSDVIPALGVDYVATADGYVRGSIASAGSSVEIRINGRPVIVIDSGTNTCQTVFVKKGAIIRLASSSGSGACLYMPFI